MKPKCTNCSRRLLECCYQTTDGSKESRERPSGYASSMSPVSQSACSSDQSPPPAQYAQLATNDLDPLFSGLDISGFSYFDMFDLELLHHFAVNLALDIAETPPGIAFFRHKIPSIAFAHLYVLHAALAVSALHLARKDPSRKVQCLEKAEYHHSVTLTPMVEAMSHSPDSIGTPLWICSVLLCLYYLAKGPQPGQFLVFSDSGERTEWMWLARGTHSIVHQYGIDPRNVWDDLPAEAVDDSGDVLQQSVRVQPIAFQEPIDRLRRFWYALALEDSSLYKYRSAIDTLEECFVSALEVDGGADGCAVVHSRVVFRWIFHADDKFASSLQERRPLALIIFAHWMVLFSLLGQKWYLEGWTPTIMEGIIRHMPVQHRQWLNWPAKMLRTPLQT